MGGGQEDEAVGDPEVLSGSCTVNCNYNYNYNQNYNLNCSGCCPHNDCPGGTGSPPDQPPTPDDRTFVVSVASGCRSQSVLTIQIPVTRYLGPTDSQSGALLNWEQLVSAGLLSELATLRIAAFDVDYNGSGSGCAPERDGVTFNDYFAGHLTGRNRKWHIVKFAIPIQALKFPAAPGENGLGPAEALNTLRIDIDTLPGQQSWETAIGWVSLEIKCMSPVVLIHGNSSDGEFFERQGFTAKLDDLGIPWDNSIALAPLFRAANARVLLDAIPPVARQFGVDSIHLVVHSKGGLDTRAYLANYHANQLPPYQVLSYNSLSTPHNGSLLAEVAQTRAAVAERAAQIDFVDFPAFGGWLTYLVGTNDGNHDLQPAECAKFNRDDLPNLPRDTIYNTVAADADSNGNREIDTPPPDEYAGLRIENATLRTVHNVDRITAAHIVDTMYQILRTNPTIAVSYYTFEGPQGPGLTIASITAVPPNPPVSLGNDTLVTIPSGHGAGSFDSLVTHRSTFGGVTARDHSTVADGNAASVVAVWLLEAERRNGDLK